MDDENLRSETQEALREEEERCRRLADREQQMEDRREVSEGSLAVTTKLILDQDEETRTPLVQVHRNLVTSLKPHQVDGESEHRAAPLSSLSAPRVFLKGPDHDPVLDGPPAALLPSLRRTFEFFSPGIQGVQFMWDCCCESVKEANSSHGSGCILAHCMGLGKTLQVTGRSPWVPLVSRWRPFFSFLPSVFSPRSSRRW